MIPSNNDGELIKWQTMFFCLCDEISLLRRQRKVEQRKGAIRHATRHAQLKEAGVGSIDEAFDLIRRLRLSLGAVSAADFAVDPVVGIGTEGATREKNSDVVAPVADVLRRVR